MFQVVFISRWEDGKSFLVSTVRIHPVQLCLQLSSKSLAVEVMSVSKHYADDQRFSSLAPPKNWLDALFEGTAGVDKI